MKKDIPQYKVEDLAIAVVPNEKDERMWDTYVLNLRDEPIRSLFINSRGYGEIDGERKETSVLRHFFEQLGPMAIAKIEPIPRKLFSLTNEYWVSFQYNGYMYDKKYVFVRGSIDECNFTTIPFINKKGVMIR
ncbi:MAG TPA: hypothetical protein ENJ45_01845 [Phaeodactylibacter sp.]|nr:hypothetical protein [Phaeodactylibacter sp.]